LPSDVKKSSILLALDAAGVDIKDVIQDAIRRDRALDTYERVQQRAVEELESKKTKENSDIQAQIDKYVTEQRAKIQSNSDAISREKERFTGWRLKKQQEEKKIAEAVGYFVAENPITTGDAIAPASSPKATQRS
jgi:recombination DNA repair RAD52 pathway protein